MNIQPKIGCDPEVFVSYNGKVVSAYGMVTGDKKNPTPMGNGAIQVDGMALEFNTRPATGPSEFSVYVEEMLDILKRQLPKGHELEIVPFVSFDQDYIKAQPEEATELGCDPDYNAWTGERNPRPNSDLPIRTASGHIHIGWTNDMDINDPDHIEACHMMVKQLDCSLGIISPLWDTDPIRRTMYGQLGAFRPKSYGVEYRVLSNAWIKNDETRKWVYSIAEMAFHDLMSGKKYYEGLEKPSCNLTMFNGGVFNRGYFISLMRAVSYMRLPNGINSALARKAI